MPSPKTPKLWIFLLWLAAFYAVWLGIVIAGNHWHTLREHWGIALAMFFGSYVAGSTPRGGGTVGFPILVLLFVEPATLGRDFSFAVQSIGMTSASIFILSRRQPLEWVILRWALIGSCIGTPLGILFIAPHVSGLVIKVEFAITWASFGVLHLRRRWWRWARPWGAFIVAKIGRKSTLYVVAMLCVGQFAWTMQQELLAIGWTGLALSLLAVGVLNAGFEWLWRMGDRLERRSMPMVIKH